MAVKISLLPAVVTPSLSDIFPVVQGGVTKQESITQLATLLPTQTSGAFTPTLAFGIGAVGMTGTFIGYYVKTGIQVDIQITITLTAKGSSTGTAAVGNLPFIINNTAGAQKWIPMLLQNSISIGTTYTTFAALSIGANTSLNLYDFPQNSLTAQQLDNTNFNNNSILILSGTYWTS